MAIAVDQASLGTRTSDPVSASITLTTTATAAANSYIVLALGYFASNELITTVTGGSLTWAVAPGTNQFKAGGTAVGIVTAQAPAGLPSSTVITVNFAVSDPQAFAIGATSFTGVKTSGEIELSGTNPAGTTADANPWSSASRSISAGSVLIAADYSAVTGAGNTATSPSIEAWEATDVVDAYGCAMVYRIEPSAGSYTAGGQWAGAGTGATSYVALLAAAAAPAGDTTTRRYQIRTSRMTSW